VGGPLLDRIDMHIEVPAVPYEKLRGKGDGQTSAQIRERVKTAREKQRQGDFYNSQIPHCNYGRSARWMKAVNVRLKWRSGG
jgi:magnesium chelatase family protein